jgi:hypothetical protein
MLRLNSLTTITHNNILCDLHFHIVPPEYFLQVLVHLVAARVYGISCLMSFLENQLPNRFDVRNTHPIFEPYYTFCVFTEIFVIGTGVPDLPSGEDNYRFGGDVTQTIRLPINTTRTPQSQHHFSSCYQSCTARLTSPRG